MNANALILLAGLLIATPAQAVDPSKLSKPPVSHFQGRCERDDDGRKFAAKACYTKFNPANEFEPNKTEPYRRPTCDDTVVTESQKELLAKAYSLAPSYAKARLCRLTQLFLTAASDPEWGSWGFWEGPDLLPGTGVFIALSDRVLAGKISIADGENDIVRRLLHPKVDADWPSFVTSDPSDSTLAVLAELAHELGHVLLSDTNADGTDRRHPRRKVSGPPRSKCFEHAFLKQSWKDWIFYQNMRRWVAFGVQNGNKQRNIVFDLEKMTNPADEIMKIYNSREFVNVYAAISPEEDFVETYRYKVLADVKVSLMLRFPRDGRNINVLSRLASRVPAKKVACLRALGLLAG
jgi:hypothetical protein